MECGHINPLKNFGLNFSQENNLRYFVVHSIVEKLGEKKADVLPAFQAFTACDVTAAFASIEKKTAWKTWAKYNEITLGFECILSTPCTETV